jgi:nucleoid-associated protein YgaU
MNSNTGFRRHFSGLAAGKPLRKETTMKRDARIGLAVVLVLGLAVTLLVGRALYKRNPATPPPDTEEVAGGDAQPSTEIHADTPNQTPAPAAAANVAQPTAVPGAGRTEPAWRVPDPTAVQHFMDGSNTPAPTANAHPQNAAPTPTGTPVNNAPHSNTPAPNVAGDHTAPPHAANNNGGSTPADAGWEDHEGTSATPTAAQPPADGYGYVVKPGDNPWKISASVYGDGKYMQKIVEANPGMNTLKVKAGTVIRIPAIPHKTVLMKLPSFAEAKLGAHSSPAAPAAAPAEEHSTAPVAANTHAPVTPAAESEVPAGGTTHKVESGETLGSIAKKYYGSGGPKSVAMIVNANKGIEPTRLKVGQELVIPAKK